MMDDMSNGDIAVIITKDLSRLGRNQLHTGLYIEEIFPSNDVRYIAVNDNVDTKYENSNELMPFKNLFNEWHVRDCSRKVRNVVNAKAQRGIRVGTRAPYGYRKGATKDSPLLVDEEAAAVVKRIFAMCAGGMGPAQIAKQLKKECIYSPSMYAYAAILTMCTGWRKWWSARRILRSSNGRTIYARQTTMGTGRCIWISVCRCICQIGRSM